MAQTKKKIIHVVSSLKIGGAERFVIDLAEQQIDKGHKVAILSFGDRNEPLVEIASAKGIKVHSINNASKPLGQLAILKVLFMSEVIHIHTSYALKTLSIAIRLIGKKQCIYTRHGAAPVNSPEWRKIHEKFRRYITSMSFVSQEGKDIFESNYQWPEIAKKVVDNGVVLPNAQPDKLVSDTLQIGSVGRFVPLKNQISLLRAFNLLSKEQQDLFHIHFFGDGECSNQLLSYVKDNQLQQYITFHGMVTDREQVYLSFDVLAVTSETEGLSLAIMESLAYSNPVIATDVGGNGYLLDDEKNGWLVRYNDDQQLAELLLQLVNDTAAILDKGYAGREFIVENYSINNAARIYDSIYMRAKH